MQRHKRVQTPAPKRHQKRMPMKKVVKKIVDKWSKSYIEGAKKGDAKSVLKLAQLQHTGAGFGRIKYNPYQGRRWIEHAATIGSKDPRLLEQMRRLIVREEQLRDKIDHLQRYQFNNAEHNAFRFNPIGRNHSLATPRGGPLWYWKRDPKTMHKPGGRHRMEELARKQTSLEGQPLKTLEDFDNDIVQYRMYLETFHKDRPRWEHHSFRINQAEEHIPKGTQALASRFELNYAVKAVLDGKLQRRLTDPIPRPIHEYIMVSGTPSPQFVDPVTQSIQFADAIKGKLKTNLEVAYGGKTYTRDGAATMADTPAVPTPVGVIRRYTDLVDDERFNYDNITRGKPKFFVDTYETVNNIARHSYWPNPDNDFPKAMRTIKKAYKRALHTEEFNKVRMLNIEDDQEFHGARESNYVNPHFDELNERSERDFAHIDPYQMWDGDEWTEDDDMKLDNLTGVNIGWEADRDRATPVDSNFPYNGIPRRSFFLTDPFAVAKPWININEDGTDWGEEELPLAPLNKLYTNMMAGMWANTIPPDAVSDILPSTLHPTIGDGTVEGLRNRMVDPIPGSERNPIQVRANGHGKLRTNIIQRLSDRHQAYSPHNYLTRAQYSNQYTDSLAKFNAEDQIWYMNNEALDVRNLPKTNDPAVRKKQIETLVENWMEVHTMQREADLSRYTNADKPPSEISDEDEKLTLKVRNPLSGGRSTHADFALQSSKYINTKIQEKENHRMDMIHKFTNNLKNETPDHPALANLNENGHVDPAAFTKQMIDYTLSPETHPPGIGSYAPADFPEGAPEVAKPNIKLPPRHTKQQVIQRAQQRLAQLQLADPIKYKDFSVEQIAAMDTAGQIDISSYSPDAIQEFNPEANTGWILPIDLDLELGDDGHFAGYSALGLDDKAYIPADPEQRRRTKVPFHPADGSPILHDANSRLHANRKRFQGHYDQVFGTWLQYGDDDDDDVGVADNTQQTNTKQPQQQKKKLAPGDAEDDDNVSSFDMTDPDYQQVNSDDPEPNPSDVAAYQKARADHFAAKDATADQKIRQKLTNKISKMIDDYNNGTLETPAELQGSDDEEIYQQSQPFIRPYVTHYGNYHPFWNRVVPNPNVFLPGPSQSSTIVRRERNYETSMWNEYGNNDDVKYRDVKLSLESRGKDEFFDPSRATAVYDDDTVAYPQQRDVYRVYSRQEVEQGIDSGLLAVTRRKDVDAIIPPKRNLGPLNKM